MKKLLISLLMLIFIAGAALAQSYNFSYDFDEDVDVKVITSDNIDSLYGLSFFERSYLVLKLQCSANAFTQKHFKIVDGFLNNGGAVWISDSGLAQNFGFIKANFSSKDVKGKKVDTLYSYSRFYPAYACPAYPSSNSPILKGIKKVYIDCIKVGNDEYSAIKQNAEDTNFYPLLKLNEKVDCICAYRKWGKGKVIFTPTMNEKDTRNQPFLNNLKAFSYGNLVVDDKKMYKCKITFANGTVKDGFISNKNLEFFTDNENRTYDFEKVSKIRFFRPANLDEIYLKENDKMVYGIIMNLNMEFSPDEIYVEKYSTKLITQIEFE